MTYLRAITSLGLSYRGRWENFKSEKVILKKGNCKIHIIHINTNICPYAIVSNTVKF